jgi:hypothetical protein
LGKLARRSWPSALMKSSSTLMAKKKNYEASSAAAHVVGILRNGAQR